MRAFLFASAIVLVPLFAHADVIVSGSGTDSGGNTWSFSADVSTPPPVAYFSSIPVTNGQYLLNGAPVYGPITFFEFYPTSSLGLIDIGLFAAPNVVSLYGADITGLVPGVYGAGGVDNNTGLSLSGSVTISGAVPEPSSLALLGLGGIGLAVFRYRRRSIAA